MKSVHWHTYYDVDNEVCTLTHLLWCRQWSRGRTPPVSGASGWARTPRAAGSDTGTSSWRCSSWHPGSRKSQTLHIQSRTSTTRNVLVLNGHALREIALLCWNRQGVGLHSGKHIENCQMSDDTLKWIIKVLDYTVLMKIHFLIRPFFNSLKTLCNVSQVSYDKISEQNFKICHACLTRWIHEIEKHATHRLSQLKS